ncbi:zinc-binding metallopeptidase family protein [Cyclobacterium jeungdonense]|uniref:Zinc-binding metallopeptidase n=1 Tax=Cyclobacterium jeungdonense TaxID=708087 RepID=A0ABT8CD45_9BACT|nr:putative zinc-binding metallopeptidase [Cyclobacterium jeungdonense]MDN3690455.1 putative zinc-binding metallopeptidase [Cyclobacterium jeungdonense]
MKLFQCSHCGRPAYFENTHCSHCRTQLGFDPQSLDLLALEVQEDHFVTKNEGQSAFRYCENKKMDGCNWLIPFSASNRFCRACALNRVIPDLANPAYKKRWQTIEIAKHRLIYALLRWNLPFSPRDEATGKGLGFDFKASQNQENVLTGHAFGIITMNIAEADDVERAMAKRQMDEVYRTVLGHFRHEIGHYYWDVLIAESDHLDDFRTLFGDERVSYAAALETHYQNGAPSNWQQNYISSYASSHPWEDWAETWAHYLHLVDTLETAFSFGVTINPKLEDHPAGISTLISEDAYLCSDFSKLLQQWVPLALTLNSLNRSMGLQDSYPFVISPVIAKKLAFVHDLICPGGGRF